MVEIMVPLTGDTSCYGQGFISDLYYILSMHHWKLGFLFIVYGDRHLFREIEDRLFPGHSEGHFCIVKSLDLN